MTGGGSRGVLVTIAVFLQFFINVMVVKSLGMLLVPMRAEFTADTWLLGSVFALIECISDLLSPIAGPIGKMFGVRLVTMIGGAMVTVGFVLASQSLNVLQVALSLNILIATGYCFANVLARAALGQHFDNRDFALASGIAQTGTSISLVAMPPLVQLFLNTYGWRGTMLLLGSIGAHLAVCGALLVPSPTASDSHSKRGYQSLPKQATTTETHRQGENSHSVLTLFKSISQSVVNVFDLSLTKEYDFWIVTCIFVITRITKGAWIIYFVPHAVDKGFSADSAAVMVTAAGLGHLAGVVAVSVAVFKERVTSTSAMLATLILISTSLFVDPWVKSGWLMSVNAVFFMATMGAVFALGDVMVKEFFGYERMAGTYGWMGFISGIFRFFSGFIPGWIYDHSRSYDLAFVILGTIQLTPMIPLLVKRLYTNCCQRDLRK